MRQKMSIVVALLSIALVLFSVLLTSCGKELKSKKLSGEYNIEEFLSLLQPFYDAYEEQIKYATEEETTRIWNKTLYSKLRELGFKGGEEIILNGRLRDAWITDQIVTAGITDEEETRVVYITLDSVKESGWLVLLPHNTNVKLKFTITEDEIDGEKTFWFEHGEVESPSKKEFEPNCSDAIGEDDVVVMGTIKEVRQITLSQEEIEDRKDEEVISNGFWWYSAMQYASSFIIIEDEQGNEIGAFIREEYTPWKVAEGDKIACRGDVKTINFTDVPKRFMDTTLIGCFYIYE